MLQLTPILEHGKHGRPVGVKARVGTMRLDDIPDAYMATEVVYKNGSYNGSYKYYFDKEASAHKSDPMPQNVLENIIGIYRLDVLVPEYLEKIEREYDGDSK